MDKDKLGGAYKNSGSMQQTSKNAKPQTSHGREEISLELAELGNLKPKHEPMTPNQRKKTEAEKTY
jgi:hypothetical protein